MKYIYATTLLALPGLLFAQATNILSLEALILQLLTKLGYLFWIAAVMFFFWGLVKFIGNAADTKEHEEGKKFIVWGLIAFLVLISLWGIVKFFFDSAGITNPAPVCYIDKDGGQICQ